MKKVELCDLVFEVGRQCDMQCKHCLNGPSENSTITTNIVENVLSQVGNITTITFSGGEPSLYANEIIFAIDYIMKHHISVYSFYIASNGKTINFDLMNKLCEFYGYVAMECGEPEISKYEISVDQYHEKIPEINKQVLNAYSFVSYRQDYLKEEQIIKAGNALKNNIGKREQDVSARPFPCDDTCSCGTIYDMVYVNSKGFVLPDCDYSYETQDNYGAWNIKDFSLYDILSKFKVTELEKTA